MANLKQKVLDPKPHTSGASHTHQIISQQFKRTNDMYTNTVGRAASEITNLYGKVVDNPVAERVTNGILMKGWRALLFTNREGLTHRINPAKNKEDFQGENVTGKLNVGFYGDHRTDVGLKNENRVKSSLYRNEHGVPAIFVGHDLEAMLGQEGKRSGYNVEYIDLLGISTAYNPQDQNQVIIYNLSEVTNGEPEPFIALQIRPKEVEARPETSWAEIKSMGRNTPMYHYLGAQDALHINTSWFIKGKPSDPGFNPYWVINQCRRLKSWSMANGYVAAPPVLRIQWGRADIFKDELWILTSAAYHLGNFSDKVMVKRNLWSQKDNLMIPQKEVQLIDAGLVPFTATQELIFRRVSSHSLLTEEIYNYQEPAKSET